MCYIISRPDRHNNYTLISNTGALQYTADDGFFIAAPEQVEAVARVRVGVFQDQGVFVIDRAFEMAIEPQGG